MVSDDQIKRINELARKQKAEGLSKEEQEEQTELRNLYIQSVKNSLKNSLSTVKIIDPNGNDVTPKQIKALRNSRLH